MRSRPTVGLALVIVTASALSGCIGPTNGQIDFTIENNAPSDQRITVELLDRGTVVQSETYTIAPSETRTFDPNTTPDVRNEYSVRVTTDSVSKTVEWDASGLSIDVYQDRVEVVRFSA